MFSTHYHELTELEGKIKGVKNYRISVKEEGDDIVFLRKIIEGSADKSYGIQVAKLAGLPKDVVQRAREILVQLELNDIVLLNQALHESSLQEAASSVETDKQLDFDAVYQNEIISEIREINILETTPIEAINYLAKLQKKINSLYQEVR
jgi:DNA mismatch repair protein MutS